MTRDVRPWVVWGATAGSSTMSGLSFVTSFATQAKAEARARSLIQRGDPKSARSFRDYVDTSVSGPDGRSVLRCSRARWRGDVEQPDVEYIEATGQP